MKYDPEIVKKADEYFGALLRTLTPRKRDVAMAARGIIHLGYHPSAYKVCKQIGRKGLNQDENYVRYRVLWAYTNVAGELNNWRVLARTQMVNTGLMFKGEILQ